MVASGAEVGNDCNSNHEHGFGTIYNRPAGSPMARSWPLTQLQPCDPVLKGNAHTLMVNQAPINGITDSAVEFIHAVELLKQSAKSAVGFRL